MSADHIEPDGSCGPAQPRPEGEPQRIVTAHLPRYCTEEVSVGPIPPYAETSNPPHGVLAHIKHVLHDWRKQIGGAGISAERQVGGHEGPCAAAIGPLKTRALSRIGLQRQLVSACSAKLRANPADCGNRPELRQAGPTDFFSQRTPGELPPRKPPSGYRQ